MSSNRKQPKWDIYEAVILLEGFLEMLKGEQPKLRIIKQISENLRKMAVNRGMEIDNTYRNVNGITFQINSMESAYNDVTGHKAATKLFKEAVDLYRKDINKYNEILDEAKAMSEDSMDNEDKISFLDWMIDCAKMSEGTAKLFELFLNQCDTYANNEQIYIGSITGCDYCVFKERYDLLISRSDFKKYGNGYPASAIKKYSEYMAAFNIQEEIETVSEQKDFDSGNTREKCIEILKNEFEDGYRIGNYMHRQSFISFYEETFDENIPDEIEDIDEFLKSLGQVVDGRVFVRKESNSDSILSRIYEDIENTFDNGATLIYLECIYEKYEHELVDKLNVYSFETMQNVFLDDNNFPASYTINKSKIQKKGVSKNLNYEVEKCLKESHVPLSYDEIHEILWNIPIRKIKTALQQINDAVNVGEGLYYYAFDFNIPADEMSALLDAMHDEIYSKGYIVTKDLRELFRESCPVAAMDSEQFKDHAIREILKVLLGSYFNFNGSVITEKGQDTDISSIYRNFAADHERLTLSQIQELSDELDTNIYWSEIMAEMVRVSSSELVSKSLVDFDVEAIDNVLGAQCDGDFMVLKDVSGYLSFPNCGYKWNGFVLESYLRDYSKEYCLIQLGISNNNYIGAMVRKNSSLKTYDDVAAEVLALKQGWSDQKSALVCLVDSGLQQRSANKNIAAIIKMAKNIIAEKK